MGGREEDVDKATYPGTPGSNLPLADTVMGQMLPKGP